MQEAGSGRSLQVIKRRLTTWTRQRTVSQLKNAPGQRRAGEDDHACPRRQRNYLAKLQKRGPVTAHRNQFIIYVHAARLIGVDYGKRHIFPLANQVFIGVNCFRPVANLEVQMGAGGISRIPAAGDDLAAFHPVSR